MCQEPRFQTGTAPMEIGIGPWENCLTHRAARRGLCRTPARQNPVRRIVEIRMAAQPRFPAVPARQTGSDCRTASAPLRPQLQPDEIEDEPDRSCRRIERREESFRIAHDRADHRACCFAEQQRDEHRPEHDLEQDDDRKPQDICNFLHPLYGEGELRSPSPTLFADRHGHPAGEQPHDHSDNDQAHEAVAAESVDQTGQVGHDGAEER